MRSRRCEAPGLFVWVVSWAGWFRRLSFDAISYLVFVENSDGLFQIFFRTDGMMDFQPSFCPNGI